MAAKQKELANLILQDPAVESLSSFVGADGTNTTTNSGRMSINLKPLEERNMSAADVIRRLNGKLEQIEGIQLFLSPVQNITVDDRVSRAQFQYALEAPDQNQLDEWTNKFVERLRELPELEGVATDQQPGGLAMALDIDRVTASRLGIAPTTIDNTLYDAFGQRQINTTYTQVNQYHVVMEVLPYFQQNPDALNHIYIQANASSGASGAGASTSFSASASPSAGSNAVTTSALFTPSANTLTPPVNALALNSTTSATGVASAGATSSTYSNAVPLSAFCHFRKTTESLSINHQGQFPAITVSFNLAKDSSLGAAIAAVDKAQKDLNMPASVQHGFQGTAASFVASLSNEPLLILAARHRLHRARGAL